jgi:hypothetical protein
MLPPTITYLGPTYPFGEAGRQSRQAGARIDGQDRRDDLQSRHPTPPRFEVSSAPSRCLRGTEGRSAELGPGTAPMNTPSGPDSCTEETHVTSQLRHRLHDHPRHRCAA